MLCTKMATMEDEILTIQKRIIFDESIAHYETHAHQPFATTTFNNNDEIHIAVQHQDLCLLPSRSTLHIYGRLTKQDGTAPCTSTKFVNNAICHMFEEIRYELNAVEIERCKNVGITTLMKNYVSLNPGQKALMENAGWFKDDDDDEGDESTKLTDNQGYFNISIPLSLILGFAEDYRKVIVNAKHELILTRTNIDTNAIIQTAVEQYKISLTKIEWIIPYIKVSDQRKIQLLNFIAKDMPISMGFRVRELYKYPLLPATSHHIWEVKTSTQLEKPRFIILGFQTARENHTDKNASNFDHCKIRNVKVLLNSQSYPYGNMNQDIVHNQFALLYDMYANFQVSYYGKEQPEPLLNKAHFLKYAPLIVIDCSKQNESLKSGPVDIRIEFEASEPFPPQTSAYCLILHDRIVEYNPISGNVKKLT